MKRAGFRAHLIGASITLGAISCVTPVSPPPRLLPPRRIKKPAPPKDYSRKLPPGQFALRKIVDPQERPELSLPASQRSRLLQSTKRSLSYLAKKSSQSAYPKAGIRHEQVLESLEALRDLLASSLTCEQVRGEIDRRFDIYSSVGCDDRGTVLFTGYYTPIFQASLEATEDFRFPIHRPPTNHVKDPRTGETLGLREPDGRINSNYPSRHSLVSTDALEGLELAWLRSAFEAYIVGVQGSAILELRSGERLEVGYAGTNGHPYRSLGRALIAAGKIREQDLNLRRMIQYFSDHPDEFEPLAAANGRYVFFQESSGGPFGCLNEKVTAMTSLATDKSIFPRGALCFIDAKLPDPSGAQRSYRGFALDQDAGGAIQAPGRCDVFMGVGEEAGRQAGRTLAEGRLYYLFLKTEPSVAMNAR